MDRAPMPSTRALLRAAAAQRYGRRNSVAAVRRRRAERSSAMQARAFSGMLIALIFMSIGVIIASGAILTASSAFALAQDGIRRYPVASTTSGRLDAALPQTATITARDGSPVSYVNDVHF